MELGKWVETTYFIWGIKASEERFKELYKDYLESIKENGCDENSELFWLHHDIDGLDGYWIGDRDNPEGLVVGYRLYNPESYEELSFNEYKKIDLELIKKAIDNVKYQIKEIFDYEKETQEFLNSNDKMELHIVTEKYFKPKEVIKIRSKYNFNKNDVKWVKENKWDARNIEG